MAEHALKTLAPYWDAIKRGDKNFEVRRDDRGFQRGDVLILRKLGENGATGELMRRRVSYILQGGQFGIEPGYVVMALEPIEADGSPDAR